MTAAVLKLYGTLRFGSGPVRVQSGLGLVRFGFGPVWVWSGSGSVWSGSGSDRLMWRVRSVPSARWRVPRACRRMSGMCWHVLARGRSCRNFHRRVEARGGSGETVLHAILQIG
uniref:Uncharacterized protein n=1 Tax=Fagus sylvatica TaxID=28930 RepID=A0A2N9GSD3_FAGSY